MNINNFVGFNLNIFRYNELKIIFRLKESKSGKTIYNFVLVYLLFIIL
jgi:hypothetical protein